LKLIKKGNIKDEKKKTNRQKRTGRIPFHEQRILKNNESLVLPSERSLWSFKVRVELMNHVSERMLKNPTIPKF